MNNTKTMILQMQRNKRCLLFFLKKMSTIHLSVSNVCEVLTQTNGAGSFVAGEAEYREKFGATIRCGAKPLRIVAPNKKGGFQQVTVYDIADTDLKEVPRKWSYSTKETLALVYKDAVAKGIKIELASMHEPMQIKFAEKHIYLNRNNVTEKNIFFILKGMYMLLSKEKDRRICTSNAIMYALVSVAFFQVMTGETLPDIAYDYAKRDLKLNLESVSRMFKETIKSLEATIKTKKQKV